ncbi:MAG: arabinose ABC transporter permease, partial [Betaproteobacteria bacterium]|nr:arabinose ABC transporter permease [Betaproteobacteria bacterium]
MSVLAPFRTRAFRYQWPADLATSWAVEMEVLILGWYILVESESVVLLVFFGALQYLGSLVSPMFGVAGDRFGYGRLLWMTRALYAVMAALLGCLAASDLLSPTAVLIIAGLNGLVRPSDMVMRYALIAQYLPGSQLMGALGISRITSDSARIAGALAGAGVVAMFGMAPAYLVVTTLYVVSFMLSLQVVSPRKI